MFDFSSIKVANTKAKENLEVKREEYQPSLEKAIELFYEGVSTNNSTKFYESAEKFVDCLELKKDNVEPYAYLGAIYYLFEQDKYANHYYDKAKAINPEYPFLKELEKQLINNL